MKQNNELNKVFDLLSEEPDLIFISKEIASPNKIYFLLNKDQFNLAFKVNGEFELINKKYDDIANIILIPSKTVGYETKLIIKFKDDKKATCLIKKNQEAIVLCTNLLKKYFDEKDPYKFCDPLNDLESPKDGVINVYGDFKANKLKKLFKLISVTSIPIMGFAFLFFLLFTHI